MCSICWSLAGHSAAEPETAGSQPHAFGGGGRRRLSCTTRSPWPPFSISVIAGRRGRRGTVELLQLLSQAPSSRGPWSTACSCLRAAAQIPGHLCSLSLYEHTLQTTTAPLPGHSSPRRAPRESGHQADCCMIWTRPIILSKTIVPSTEIVHDRTMLELFRGCIRGCRFCQAGFCYRPVRAAAKQRLW